MSVWWESVHAAWFGGYTQVGCVYMCVCVCVCYFGQCNTEHEEYVCVSHVKVCVREEA